MGLRIKIAPDGTLRLPKEIADRLGWKTGSTLEVSEEGGVVRLERLEVDPFAEAQKAPEPDAFEKRLAADRKRQEEARRTFEERLKAKDLPELRPEDRPDFWR